MAHASRDSHHARVAQQKSPGGFSSFLLFLTGIGIALFGAGLLHPPTAVPHADWIATKFSRLGVEGLPFIAAGMTIFCMGLIARLQSKIGRQAPVQEDSEIAPEVARLVGELSQVRGALGNVQTELLANKQRQDSMLDSIKVALVKESSSDNNSNAMFRLAASLDQLGARIEERLRTQGVSFEGRLSDVTNAVVRAQQEVTEAVDQVERHLAQFGRYEPDDSSASYSDDLGYEEAPQRASAEEELEILVELEEDVQPAVQRAPKQAEPKLGLLDSLDDFGSLVKPEAPLPNSQQNSQTSTPPRPSSWPPSRE